MKQIDFSLDFISPYAYLAFEELPKALIGLSYSVNYKPVFLGGLLKHHGQLGPAEIPAKRDWTYRHVLWLAQQHGIALQMPATHPFNPLALLRLALASEVQGLPSRYVCETLFRHVWVGGADAADAARLEAVTKHLLPRRDPNDAARKDELKALGVFGVPAFVVDGKTFWGLDGLPMLRQYLEGKPWFDGPDWDSVQTLPSALPARKP